MFGKRAKTVAIEEPRQSSTHHWKPGDAAIWDPGLGGVPAKHMTVISRIHKGAVRTQDAGEIEYTLSTKQLMTPRQWAKREFEKAWGAGNSPDSLDREPDQGYYAGARVYLQTEAPKEHSIGPDPMDHRLEYSEGGWQPGVFLGTRKERIHLTPEQEQDDCQYMDYTKIYLIGTADGEIFEIHTDNKDLRRLSDEEGYVGEARHRASQRAQGRPIRSFHQTSQGVTERQSW